MDRKVRKEKAALLVTQKDSEALLDHRGPQERLVSPDSQGPKVTAVCLAETVLKDCRVHKVHQGSWASLELRESLERYFLTCDSKVTKETQVFQDNQACQEEREPLEEMATQDFLDPKAPRVW